MLTTIKNTLNNHIILCFCTIIYKKKTHLRPVNREAPAAQRGACMNEYRKHLSFFHGQHG